MRTLHEANTFLVLSVVLIVGVGAGMLAKRFKLPSVTGQILAGVFIGPAVLGWVPLEAAERLESVIQFALGLMAVDVGSHLSLRRLRNAKLRLALLVLCEITLTPTLVFAAVRLSSNTHWTMALLLGAIAVSTAPATVLALVKETRSKGVFVKTLVAAVALNNLFCILVFEVAHVIATGEALGYHETLAHVVEAPLRLLALSGLLACAMGAALVTLTRNTVRQDRLTAASLIAILLTMGVAEHFHLSVLLSCLFLGVFLENVTPDKDELGPSVFVNFEVAIYATFFTIAGMELQFRYLSAAGLVAVAMFLARATGKVGAGYVSMRLAGATDRIRRFLGLALLPQAGLAVGLMLLVTDNPAFEGSETLRAQRDLFLAVVLAVVLLNELVGPILTRAALARSGDLGKDRRRVLDFLREEHIVCGLRAEGMDDAVTQLVDHLLRVYPIRHARGPLLEALRDEELSASSCLGEGLALPHARVPDGKEIEGVMGIFPDGFEANTPDGLPIRCIVVLVSPAAQQDHHLAVLASFARAIGHDANVRNELYKARTPAHAYELLHAEEGSELFNKYLDEA